MVNIFAMSPTSFFFVICLAVVSRPQNFQKNLLLLFPSIVYHLKFGGGGGGWCVPVPVYGFFFSMFHRNETDQI